MVGIRLTLEFTPSATTGPTTDCQATDKATWWDLLCGQGFLPFIQRIPVYLLVKYWKNGTSHELSEPAAHTPDFAGLVNHRNVCPRKIGSGPQVDPWRWVMDTTGSFDEETGYVRWVTDPQSVGKTRS